MWLLVNAASFNIKLIDSYSTDVSYFSDHFLRNLMLKCIHCVHASLQWFSVVCQLIEICVLCTVLLLLLHNVSAFACKFSGTKSKSLSDLKMHCEIVHCSFKHAWKFNYG